MEWIIKLINKYIKITINLKYNNKINLKMNN